MSLAFFSPLKKSTRNSVIKKYIINYYIKNGNSTIADLSKEIDLSVPTVTKLIEEMCTEGYINDCGKLETVGGRHPILYGLNPKSAYFVGVDIKHFSINLGLINMNGDLVDIQTGIPFKMENTKEILDDLCLKISKFIKKQKIDRDRILNIGVNISGRVNPESGYSYSLFYFNETPLADILSEKLGYRVMIDNDTRSMAYGEYISGCVKDEKNIIFVNISWGLAIGIIIDGKIYTGKSGFSGEFGHIKTYDNEILCHCGKKGCLETEASGLAIHRRLNELVAAGASSSLSSKILNGELVTIKDITTAVNEEDVLCIELVEELGQKLGIQIAGLINIFNPELVIIGGSISVTEDYILQPLKTSVKKYSLNIVNKDSKIVISQLKEKAGIIGACMMARSRLFEV